MKKIIPVFLVLVFLLSACGAGAPEAPSDGDMATRVAAILTAMPTGTGEAPAQTSEAPLLPTIAPTSTPTTAVEVLTAIPGDTATPQPVAETPTATVEGPQATPTENLTPVPTFTPQGGATQAPTATASADDPRVKLGSPAWTDTMDSSGNWPTGDSDYTRIEFSGGSMLFTPLKTIAGWRLTWPKLDNQYIEMSVRSGKCSGNDSYGIIFRVPELNDPDQGYLLGMSCEGKYSLRLWDGRDGAKGKMTTLIPWTASDQILAGADQLNRLGVMMIGNRLLVYINGKLVREANDSTFKEGYFGVFAAQGDAKTEFTIRVEEISYWKNPQP